MNALAKTFKTKEVISLEDKSLLDWIDDYIGLGMPEVRELVEELNILTRPAKEALITLLISVRTTSESWGAKHPPPPLARLILEKNLKDIPKGRIKSKGRRKIPSKK